MSRGRYGKAGESGTDGRSCRERKGKKKRGTPSGQGTNTVSDCIEGDDKTTDA